jgi:hypothetical protein
VTPYPAVAGLVVSQKRNAELLSKENIGLSENMVPKNPVVSHHFPCANAILGCTIFSTRKN